jgi:hypothetical protein
LEDEDFSTVEDMGVCSVSLPLDVAVGSVDDMVVFIIMQDV